MTEPSSQQGYEHLLAQPSQPGKWAVMRLCSRPTDARDILLARGEPWLVAVLLPIETSIGAVRDERSQGVRVYPLQRPLEESPGPTLCIQCEDPRLLDVFLSLIDDLVRRVSDLPLAAINHEVEEALADWRKMLSAASNPLAREVAMGMVGELEVLWHMRATPDAALDCWGGPLGEIHDFSLPAGSLEVKASSTVDGLTVEISSLDQLTPRAGLPLHLVVHHVRENRQAPPLDSRFDRLVTHGYQRERLSELCEQIGYVPGSAPDTHRYDILTTRAWLTHERFPGLRRSDLPEGKLAGIERLRYSLDLSGQLGQEVSLDDALTATGWGVA